jgi:membrane fusion protein, adhesin transport system
LGGEVAAIDPTDDGTGKFRIQVQPSSEDEWPSGRFLRQGVRANGWVMLSRVRLGYEIWRQLNGFPPVISPDESSDESKWGKRKKG